MSTTTDSSPASPSSPAPPDAARSRGRPRKVDNAARRKICVLVSIGYDLRQAAHFAGCSYPTIRRETLRHSEFRRVLRQALKMKAEVNVRRGSSREFDQNLVELRQKLGIPPTAAGDDL